MAATTVLSLAAFLGLAIAGAGPRAVLFLSAVDRRDPGTIALGFAGLFSERHIGSGVRGDRSNR
jgi:hypothetical protein